MSSPAAGGAVFTVAFDYHNTAHRPLPRSLAYADRIGDYFATYGGLQWQRSGLELAADDPAAVAGSIARWAAGFRKERCGQTLVLYIGGHGMMERGEHYTLTGHSPTGSPVTGHNALKASAVIDEVLVSGAGQALLIFDSCQSGGAAADILDALRRVMLNEAQPTIDIVTLAGCLPYEEALSGVLVENMLAALTEGFGDYGRY